MNRTAPLRARLAAKASTLVAFTALAAAAVLPLQAQAQISNVIIFGDSLSDSGNNGLALGLPSGVPQAITSDSYIPSLPYFPSGNYSNGPVWATSFAAGLGLSAAPSLGGGTNFAFGGARVSVDGTLGGFPYSLRTQVGQFLGATGNVAPSDALYVIAGGGNDARDALASLGASPSLPEIVGAISQASAQFAINVGALVDTLQAAGAQNIVVWNAPDLGLAPAVRAQGAQAAALGTLLASNMNEALDYRLASETGVTTFDIFSFTNLVAANPAAYGLSNVVNACVTGVCTDPSQYLFWDGIHPSAAGHALLSEAMLAAVVPEPATYLMMALGLGALLVWRKRAA
jgi:outer membrane lipase/esterase